MIDNNKLKIAIICENGNIHAWKNDFIKKLSKSNFAEIICLVLNERKESKNSFSVLAYKKFDSQFKITKNALEKQKNIIFDSIDKKIYLNTFSILETTEFLNLYEIDLIISLTENQLPDEIYSISKYGMLKIQHGILSKYPNGFIEVIKQKNVIDSKIILCKDDHKHIISQSYSMVDPFSVKRTMNSVFWKGASLLYHSIRKFSIQHENMNILSFHSDVSNEKINLITLCKWLYKKYYEYKNTSKKYFEQWTLMYNLEEEISFSFKNFKKISHDPNRFYADPFVIYQDKQYFIFFEESLFSKSKGWISYIKLDDNGNITKPETILKRNYHLSYPSIFEFDGEYYMIPESSEVKRIDLFKCIDFPKKWKFHKTLLDNVYAVDPTITYTNGKWWLFTGTRFNSGMSPSDELSLFYSDDPISKSWTPHLQNPIVSDVRNARPAGNIFKKNNTLFRPAQNSSKSYGYGITINEIKTINETNYVESINSKILPNWDNMISGIHTINHSNNLTVIDVKHKQIKIT